MRLGQRGIDQASVDQLQLLEFATVQHDAQMPAEIPLVEQAQFARQHRLVVGRQVGRAGHRLQQQ
jgi:hypothetical protein